MKLNINIDKAFDTIMYKINNPHTTSDERLKLLDFLRDWDRWEVSTKKIKRMHKYKPNGKKFIKEFTYYVQRLDYLARNKYEG